ERHPGLTLVLAESGLGWLPYFLKRMDLEWLALKDNLDYAPAVPPSELFHRQVVAAFEEDELAAQVVPRLGAASGRGASEHIHTHYDAQVFWDPQLRPSSYHGVTTVVAGNCGFAIAPTREEHHEVIARTLENVEDMNVDTLSAGIAWEFQTFPEYLDTIRRRGTLTTVTVYAGHS